MASTGRSGDVTAQRRPTPRGLVAAYLFVFALIAGSAGVVLGDLVDAQAPRSTNGAATASPVSSASAAAVPTEPAPVQALPLTPRPPPSLGSRKLPSEEVAAMIEITADGLRLPRISPSGWMPWIAHARRFDPSAGAPARLGLLMINVGLNEPAMRKAIEELPPEVSLAFLPGTPDLPRWLQQARAFGHETYLMLPMDDPAVGERGLRPIEAAADAAENLKRLRAILARGEGYVGLVIAAPARPALGEGVLRPLVKEIADRGLALIEINPTAGPASIQRLTEELGVGYARSTDVLDYKLAGDGVVGNLDRLAAWVAESAPDRAPRHAFGVAQPDEEAIVSLRGWYKGQEARTDVSMVPIIGHFECRDACLNRMRAQPAQLRP